MLRSFMHYTKSNRENKANFDKKQQFVEFNTTFPDLFYEIWYNHINTRMNLSNREWVRNRKGLTSSLHT